MIGAGISLEALAKYEEDQQPDVILSEEKQRQADALKGLGMSVWALGVLMVYPGLALFRHAKDRSLLIR